MKARIETGLTAPTLVAVLPITGRVAGQRPTLSPLGRPPPAIRRASFRAGLLLLPVPGMAALLVWAGAALITRATGPNASGPAYSVTALRAGLARDPRAWAGRTIRVRGVADSCAVWVAVDHSLCTIWETSLHDARLTWIGRSGAAAHASDVGWLPLRWGSGHPLLALLRRVPGLALLVPAPQPPAWGTAATYRVQIQPLVRGPCSGAMCYAAVLLDADPATQPPSLLHYS